MLVGLFNTGADGTGVVLGEGLEKTDNVESGDEFLFVLGGVELVPF